MNSNNGARESRYAAPRSSQFIITISPADKATDSICKAKKEGRHARVDSATGTKNSTCKAYWHSIKVLSRAAPEKIKKKPQIISTLALTLKIPIFVFLSCSSAESYTEKKRPTGGWDRPTIPCIVQCKCMLISWRCAYNSVQYSVVAQAICSAPVPSMYPSLKSYWAYTLGLKKYIECNEALALVCVYREE